MIYLLLIFSLARLAALTGALSTPAYDDTSENDVERWVAGLEVDSIDMTHRSTILFVINEYEEGGRQQHLSRQSVCFDKTFEPWEPRIVECYTVPLLSMITSELLKLEIIALKSFAHETATSEEERSRSLNEDMLVNITFIGVDMRSFRFNVSIDGVNSREISSFARDYVTETHGRKLKYHRNLWQPPDENARRIELP